MSHQVISLKYRPQRFEDVIGQDHITLTLKNAIEKNRLGHAYIFSGPRGTGKTTTARLLSKMVNCENPQDGNPCNECVTCREITEGRSLDVLEIDGASNRGIDSIRDLREQVKYPPTKGKYKVYIIDEFHQITKDAFNALLKTLEEPPKHILFIFATTELHKVLPTILSRCQRFEFKRIPLNQVMDLLRNIAEQEGIKIDDDSLLLIAKKGDGSIRDSESILEQVIAFSEKDITYESILSILGVIREEVFFEMFRALAAGRADIALNLINDMLMQGYDLVEFVSMFSIFLRDLYMVRAAGSADILNTAENMKKLYADTAKDQDEHALIRMLSIVNEELTRISKSANVKILVETLFIKLSKLNDLQQLDDVIGQVQSSEHMAHPVAEAGSRKSEAGSQKPEDRSQKAEVRSQKAEVRSQKAEVRSSKPEVEYVSPILSRRGMQSPEASKVEPQLDEAPLKVEEEVVIDIELIKKNWKAIVEGVSQSKPSLGSVLTGAGIQAINGRELKLVVEDRLALELLEKNEREISLEIKNKLNVELKLVIVKNKVADSQRVIKTKELDEAAKQIISGFDAELV